MVSCNRKMSTSAPWFLMNLKADLWELALRVTTLMSGLGGPSPGKPLVESNLSRVGPGRSVA